MKLVIDGRVDIFFCLKQFKGMYIYFNFFKGKIFINIYIGAGNIIGIF